MRFGGGARPQVPDAAACVDVWQTYNGQGNTENRLKELKHALTADGFSLRGLCATKADRRTICVLCNLRGIPKAPSRRPYARHALDHYIRLHGDPRARRPIVRASPVVARPVTAAVHDQVPTLGYLDPRLQCGCDRDEVFPRSQLQWLRLYGLSGTTGDHPNETTLRVRFLKVLREAALFLLSRKLRCADAERRRKRLERVDRAAVQGDTFADPPLRFEPVRFPGD